MKKSALLLSGPQILRPDARDISSPVKIASLCGSCLVESFRAPAYPRLPVSIKLEVWDKLARQAKFVGKGVKVFVQLPIFVAM